jgi:hypothetical protein
LAAHEPLEIERDAAEGVRIAYVAATRARDLLVVPAVGDIEYDGGWTSPLNGALYPRPLRGGEPNRRRAARRSRPIRVEASRRRAGVVDDGLSRRPRQRARRRTVHRVSGGIRTRSILASSPGIGIRRESLIVKDVPDSVVADGLRDYARWRDQREAAIADGSRPSVSVLTATEWAAIDDTP